MGEGKVARRDLVLNVFVWTANVSTSVVIIFVIKSLMSVYRFKMHVKSSGPSWFELWGACLRVFVIIIFMFVALSYRRYKKGMHEERNAMQEKYATTVSGLHFVCCAWAVWGLEKAGMIEPADMPLRTSLMFALVGAMSVGFANLSLLLNSVGFYQMAKLLMSPFVAAVEMLWLKKRFPAPALACIVVVLTGVGIVTVSDVTVNGPGLAMAALFIVMGGSQQILCGHLQNVLQLQSHQLMSNTSFLQGMILMIVGPFVDKLASSKWVLEWEVSVPGVEMLALSCLLAVAVNGTQYLVLGRFSATSFQVLGHAKTLLVLIGGWLLFDDPINPRKALGMALAFLGMIGYGYFASRPVPSGPSAAAAALQNLETHKGPDLTAAPKRPSTESGSSAALDGGYKPSTSAELDLEQPLLSWAARSGAGPTRKLRDEEAVVPGRTW